MNDRDVTIALRGISATGYHGVFDQERRDGQTFVVDAVLQVRRPDLLDDLATTVDYGALGSMIVANIERDPVDLIETLATRIAEEVVGHSFVQEVAVTVHKPAAPMPVPFGDVAVTVIRSHP